VRPVGVGDREDVVEGEELPGAVVAEGVERVGESPQTGGDGRDVVAGWNSAAHASPGEAVEGDGEHVFWCVPLAVAGQLREQARVGGAVEHVIDGDSDDGGGVRPRCSALGDDREVVAVPPHEQQEVLPWPAFGGGVGGGEAVGAVGGWEEEVEDGQVEAAGEGDELVGGELAHAVAGHGPFGLSDGDLAPR
jgi:hypothetical protein